MIEFLRRNPADAQTFAYLGLFPNNEKARTCLRTLYRRKKILFRDHVQMENGQYRLVYAAKQTPNIEHEYQLTQILIRCDVDEVRRGPDVGREFLPDAELYVNGSLFLLELDRGSEGLPQVAKQLARHKSAGLDVLWIFPSEQRMRGAMSLTDSPTAWFTTYDKALTPHEEVWVNIHGETAALPRAQTMAH